MIDKKPFLLIMLMLLIGGCQTSSNSMVNDTEAVSDKVQSQAEADALYRQVYMHDLQGNEKERVDALLQFVNEYPELANATIYYSVADRMIKRQQFDDATYYYTLANSRIRVDSRLCTPVPDSAVQGLGAMRHVVGSNLNMLDNGVKFDRLLERYKAWNIKPGQYYNTGWVCTDDSSVDKDSIYQEVKSKTIATLDVSAKLFTDKEYSAAAKQISAYQMLSQEQQKSKTEVAKYLQAKQVIIDKEQALGVNFMREQL